MKQVSPRKRGQQGTSLLEAIKTAAWRQVSAEGAAALSLRAIARGLGITAPAIYNYFHRRDDLVTALVVDAYTAFGASQAAAVSGLRADDHAGRLRALGVAYRRWALASPERYQLMFGAPYPGYRIPAEVVGPVAGRALSVLVGVLEQARRAGALRPVGRGSATAGAALRPGLPAANVESLYGSADPGVLRTAVSIWTRVHGPVAIELSGQYPPFTADPEQVYQLELDALVDAVIGAAKHPGSAPRREMPLRKHTRRS